MIELKYRNEEQLRHMDRHKWFRSEEQNRDVGQEAYVDWIQKYAARFTAWALTLPKHCIQCGNCRSDTTGDCPNPFNECRLQKLGEPITMWSNCDASRL